MTSLPRAPGGDRVPADRRLALDERRKRSVEELLDVRIRQADPYRILAVRNPLHGTEYLVLWPTYPSSDVTMCTCTDFARRGLGRCKHIEAATRWMEGHAGERTPQLMGRPPVSGPSPWVRIDRAIRARRQDLAPASLALRKPGRILFERPRRSMA